MIRETFLCVKQVEHVLLVKRKDKEQVFLMGKKL